MIEEVKTLKTTAPASSCRYKIAPGTFHDFFNGAFTEVQFMPEQIPLDAVDTKLPINHEKILSCPNTTCGA